jgi:hypothetical protein
VVAVIAQGFWFFKKVGVKLLTVPSGPFLSQNGWIKANRRKLEGDVQLMVQGINGDRVN